MALKQQKTTVYRYVSTKKVLKAAVANGKKVELWPYVVYTIDAHPLLTTFAKKGSDLGCLRSGLDCVFCFLLVKSVLFAALGELLNLSLLYTKGGWTMMLSITVYLYKSNKLVEEEVSSLVGLTPAALRVRDP
ncbi:Heavy metal-associated isoprenylated plant protein 24 [Sesamum angolense]|uniref:Heavy metal-associated isoprenylated plant protein 24 n=1 Tax=Sesamum angolense TaxID=2727404 RepID=A0AAE2BN22_9LAMI|nr:Heavy metal-associated isoprenylated plant protein 24 [Sesamum angolense]